MKIKKRTIIKTASTVVIFKGVDTVVDSGVKLIVPESNKFYKKILTKIGSKAISAAITHAIQKEINDIIDTAMGAIDVVDELKKEAYEAAKNCQNEEVVVNEFLNEIKKDIFKDFDQEEDDDGEDE